jgi:hypothetical protein
VPVVEEASVNLRKILMRRKAAEPTVAYAPLEVVMLELSQRDPILAAQVEALATTPTTPDELRRMKELEAGASMQPFEWASHVYVTAHDEVRWRCCGNLFGDAHSVYCASPGSRG